MQKQHLHVLLLVLGCCGFTGCGEKAFAPLNAYLHGDQEVSYAIADSVFVRQLIYGWEFLPVKSPTRDEGQIVIVTPDAHRVTLDWVLVDIGSPILFSTQVRTLSSVLYTNPALGLKCAATVARDGRTLSAKLEGETSGEVRGRVQVELAGAKARGLAAMEQSWEITEKGASLSLPWGDRWKFSTTGTITPAHIGSDALAGEITFANSGDRNYKIVWSTSPGHRGERGLDIHTASKSVDEALALLIASVPASSGTPPSDSDALQEAANRSLASWLVHAEYSPGYLDALTVSEDQLFMITNGLAAYQTLYAWGCLPADSVLAKEPLLAAVMSQVDTTSTALASGGNLESRLREATIWTFAEENLATDRPNIRKMYREQAYEALDDVQDELKARVRLWRRENALRKLDDGSIAERFIGSDSPDRADDRQEVFIAPDTSALLTIAARGSLSWFSEVSPKWAELDELSWPHEMDRLRWRFSQDLKLRLTNHWSLAQAALQDREHPGQFPEDHFGATPVESACAEIETVVLSYLGIKPRWRERQITFDARLPEEWGRTRARIPFEDGELYVDYDFPHNEAWLASSGLSETYTCQFYMPTTSGAISAQFKLEPGESPHHITLIVDPGNKYRLRFESGGLPE